MAQSQDPVTIKADQVIMAIGQRLDISQLTGDVPLMLNDKKFISVDSMNGATNIPGVFAGGDCTDGPSSVVQAIGAGERAAVGIDEYLSGENHAFWRYEKVTETSYDPDDEVSSEKRATVRQIPVERRRHNFEEVELPWTEAIAIAQAHRCLRCDYGKHINEEVSVSTTTRKREASHV
jgi:NADH-quinone oxidoreductase subunit F